MVSFLGLKLGRSCSMSSVSASKIQEFCATVGYSKDLKEQEEFNRTLLTSARGAVESSFTGAPFSRLWGSAIGCIFCEPVKWGNFASTLTLTADRVNDSLQLTFAGMNAGMNRNPNIIIGPNNAVRNEVPQANSSPVQLALNRLISRIQPAIAADIVNQDLPEDSKISERDYNKYFIVSSVAGVLAPLGIVIGSIVAAAVIMDRR